HRPPQAFPALPLQAERLPVALTSSPLRAYGGTPHAGAAGTQRMSDDQSTREAAKAATPYDRIAGLYDPWSRSVTEDIPFYVAEAREAGGPVVELGVGTGRIAVPTAQAGIRVIGVDDSRGMLDVCRARADRAGVADLLALRLGDLRDPPVSERVRLVT